MGCCFWFAGTGRVSTLRGPGRFRAPARQPFAAGQRNAFRPPFLSGSACWGEISSPRGRGTFGTAQKYPKSRLGAAAPKYPIDVQQRACFPFRRVGVVSSLRPHPGLRPCLGRQPSRIFPIARLLRWVRCKSPPHHGQQEGKRSNDFLVLAAQFSQAGRRTIGSAWVGSSCLLPIRWVKQDPPRPERQNWGS